MRSLLSGAWSWGCIETIMTDENVCLPLKVGKDEGAVTSSVYPLNLPNTHGQQTEY